MTCQTLQPASPLASRMTLTRPAKLLASTASISSGGAGPVATRPMVAMIRGEVVPC
jgi:hypothetical protein